MVFSINARGAVENPHEKKVNLESLPCMKFNSVCSIGLNMKGKTIKSLEESVR